MKKKLIPFIKNNDEFNFKLSTHGAWMLISGIKSYVKLIDRLYRTKIEQPDYCVMMAYTAYLQAVKVRIWAIKNKTQNVNIPDLDKLILLINKKRDKFEKLEAELFGRKS